MKLGLGVGWKRGNCFGLGLSGSGLGGIGWVGGEEFLFSEFVEGESAADGVEGLLMGVFGGAGHFVAFGDSCGEGGGEEASAAVELSAGSFAFGLPERGGFFLGVEQAVDAMGFGVGDEGVLGSAGEEFFGGEGGALHGSAAGEGSGFAEVGDDDGGSGEEHFFGGFAGFGVGESGSGGGGEDGVPDDGGVGFFLQALRDGVDGFGGEERADFDGGEFGVADGGELFADEFGLEGLCFSDFVQILGGDAAEDGEGNALLGDDGADVRVDAGAASGVGGGEQGDNGRRGKFRHDEGTKTIGGIISAWVEIPAARKGKKDSPPYFPSNFFSNSAVRASAASVRR